VADPWTVKEDVEAVLTGVEAGELIEPWREWVAAADELAHIAGLLHPRNDEVARALNGY
jgi:hypothetical protein